VRKRAVQAACLAGVVVLAILLRGRKRELPATPEAAVNAMFDAAKAGDDEAYLALTGGELERRLRAARSQAGAEAFRRDLRLSAKGVVGLAISRAGDAPSPGVALVVEIVFRDRNERQRYLAAPVDGGWQITAVSVAATTRPSIPYGTPVSEG
jgi:hypothetical protein